MFLQESMMPSNSELKQLEDQFIARLRDNVQALPEAGVVQTGDDLSLLRKLTDGKLLRSELEDGFPLGRSLSVQMAAKKAGLFAKATDPLTLKGRVMFHLESVVEHSEDDRPMGVSGLSTLLKQEENDAQRYRVRLVLGLYSPTGWSEHARRLISNDPPGSGWASRAVFPILIGASTTESLWDRNGEAIGPYVECFCGLTLEERKRVCRERLERAVLVQEFANLQTVADECGFTLDLVTGVAKDMAVGAKDMVVKKVAGVGVVLKKKS